MSSPDTDCKPVICHRLCVVSGLTAVRLVRGTIFNDITVVWRNVLRSGGDRQMALFSEADSFVTAASPLHELIVTFLFLLSRGGAAVDP